MAFDTGYTPGGNQNSSNNPTATQEMQFETGGYSAEDWYLGGHVNIIPKNGGNDLHGSFVGDYSNKVLAGNEFDAGDQRSWCDDRCFDPRLYQWAGGTGCPIKDKLWFLARCGIGSAPRLQSGPSLLRCQRIRTVPQHDQNNPAYDFNTYLSAGLRLTWQATTRNKFTESWTNQANCNCFYDYDVQRRLNALTGHSSKPDWQQQATWTFPANNKLYCGGHDGYRRDESAEPPGWHATSGLLKAAAVTPTTFPSRIPAMASAQQALFTEPTGEGASAVTDNAPLDFLL